MGGTCNSGVECDLYTQLTFHSLIKYSQDCSSNGGITVGYNSESLTMAPQRRPRT